MTYEIGREECGCAVQQLHDAQVYIIYCPKHHAAPELYEACKMLIEHMTMDKDDSSRPYLADVKRQALKAIAKAEVK